MRVWGEGRVVAGGAEGTGEECNRGGGLYRNCHQGRILGKGIRKGASKRSNGGEATSVREACNG